MENKSLAVKRPLVVVPGIFGSKIDVEQDKKWKRAWPTVLLCHTKRLAMTSGGEPVYPSKVTGILGDEMAGFAYGPLLKALKKVWSTKDKTLFETPFDWRCDVEKTAAREGTVSGVPSLVTRINQVREETGADKVDIICHSMGGFAVLLYLASDPKRFDHIHRCVFLAPGFYGSVLAVNRILSGENFRATPSKFVLNRQGWKQLTDNMTGIYQIFPSALLADHLQGFLVVNGEMQDFAQSYGLEKSTHSITMDQVINLSLLRSAGEMRKRLDSQMQDKDFLDRFRECAYIFYGLINNSTAGRLFLAYPGRNTVPTIKEKKVDGDGNVIYWGWELFGLPNDRIRTFKGKTHMDMVQSPDVIDSAIEVLLK